ncbi:unnamed protein product [Heterobilharzia americana]|nr:unnamed protein product [Heterobilharzia americana]
MDFGLEQTSNSTNVHQSNNDHISATTPLNPVDVMRERARQNNVFLYIKIPGFPIRLSYKGEKQKNITDVTRFELFIPTLEYHNCVWTWLDFAMEVKTRIRKQLVREVIKKKFTPRRRVPFLRVTGSLGGTNNSGGDQRSHGLKPSSSSSSILPSVGRFGSLSTTMSAVDMTDMDSTAAQEEKAQRELEMILGRHAQIQPQQGSKRRHRKSKLL